MNTGTVVLWFRHLEILISWQQRMQLTNTCHAGRDHTDTLKMFGYVRLPQGPSGRVRKISPPPGFNPRTVQPVTSRYTGCPASCTMGTGSFPGVKRPGRSAGHPPPSKCRGQERVGLYLYSPSGSSWLCYGSIFMSDCTTTWLVEVTNRCRIPECLGLKSGSSCGFLPLNLTRAICGEVHGDILNVCQLSNQYTILCGTVYSYTLSVVKRVGLASWQQGNKWSAPEADGSLFVQRYPWIWYVRFQVRAAKETHSCKCLQNSGMYR